MENMDFVVSCECPGEVFFGKKINFSGPGIQVNRDSISTTAKGLKELETLKPGYVEEISMELRRRQRATSSFCFSKDGKAVYVFNQVTRQQIKLGTTIAEKFEKSIAAKRLDGLQGGLGYTEKISSWMNTNTTMDYVGVAITGIHISADAIGSNDAYQGNAKPNWVIELQRLIRAVIHILKSHHYKYRHAEEAERCACKLTLHHLLSTQHPYRQNMDTALDPALR